MAHACQAALAQAMGSALNLLVTTAKNSHVLGFVQFSLPSFSSVALAPAVAFGRDPNLDPLRFGGCRSWILKALAQVKRIWWLLSTMPCPTSFCQPFRRGRMGKEALSKSELTMEPFCP